MPAFIKSVYDVAFQRRALVFIQTGKEELPVDFAAPSKAELDANVRRFLRDRVAPEDRSSDVIEGAEIDLVEPVIEPPTPTPEELALGKFLTAVADAQRAVRIAALPQNLQDDITQHPDYARFV